MWVLRFLFGFASTAAWANPVPTTQWLDRQFYTDDSPYYLSLQKDGFVQRLRFHKTICQDIERIIAVFPSIRREHSSLSSGLTREWPQLYGMNEADWCWFELKVTGLDLNRPQENHYTITIKRKHEHEWHYSEEGASLLPWRRITKAAEQPTYLGRWGAAPVSGGGVYFKIWEPEADEVHLFLNSAPEPIVMKPDRPKGHPGRHHVIYLKDAKEGDEYKFQFVKNGEYEQTTVTNLGGQSPVKIDPVATRLRYDEKGGHLDGYVNPRAVVEDGVGYRWTSRTKPLSNFLDQPWLIYQIWPVAFNPRSTDHRWRQGTFRDIIPKIQYIKNLGVTAVELLPVNESRFGTGWGYALNSLTLIESTLGSRKDLAELVDRLHEAGIRVIFDSVLNHLNNDLLREPITQHVRSSKFYHGDTPWGLRPDYRNEWVRRFLAKAMVSWIRDFRIDGIRFDMTKFIYQSGPDGWPFLQELNELLETDHPGFFSSAEELPNNVAVTKPVEEGGAGFKAQWNDRFKNFFEGDASEAGPRFDDYRPEQRRINLDPLARALSGHSSHKDQGRDVPFGAPHRAVNYLGSHDFIGNKNPLIRIITDYQNFENEGGQYFTRVRPLESPNPQEAFRQIHTEFSHATVRLAYGILMTTPGPLLFFQGEELAQDLNIENEWSYVDAKNNNSIPTRDVDVNRYVGSHRMPWSYLNPGKEGELNFLTEREQRLFTGHHLLFRDLLRWRRSLADFDKQSAEVIKVYQHRSMISYLVKSGNDRFLILANFGDAVTDDWLIFPPGDGKRAWWREEFNTGAVKYGGNTDNTTNPLPHLGGRYNQVRLDGSSGAIFKLVDDLSPSAPLFLIGTFNQWETSAVSELKPTHADAGIYSAEIEVKTGGPQEFQIATENKQTIFGSASVDGRPASACEGYLSYVIDRPAVKVRLGAGKYRFRFDIRTYQFRFEELQ
jgi:1,4-alpha-glucan branching enzyme